MKSFDEMADDFVLQETSVLVNHQNVWKLTLRMAYIEGLNAGIKFCADTIEPIESIESALENHQNDEKGL